MFIQNQVYKRKELHAQYAGQSQGGISTPSGQNFIMLFTGDQGHQYGYEDVWSDGGVFYLTGEGQNGDMSFVRGNLAIRDHALNGKDLYLFEYVRVRRGHVRYIGQMVCTGFHEKLGPDIQDIERKIIVFEFTPIDSFSSDELTPNDQRVEAELWNQSLDVLRMKALASSGTARSPSERKSITRYRSQAIKVYVEKRADGKCEACGKDAPFITTTGRPYIEPHHIRRLSDGGPDNPEWVIGLCPNCHRKAHYSEDQNEFFLYLKDIIKNIENSKRTQR